MTINTLPDETNAQITGCPYHASKQQTNDYGAADGRSIYKDANDVWHVHNYAVARTILRGSSVKQAGFQAELIGETMSLGNDPMLYKEGPEHHALRKNTARFFTPKAVKAYDEMIVNYVDEMLAHFKEVGRLDLSDLTMKLAVRVASKVVGMTNSDIEGMRQRTAVFFDMPVMSKEDYRTLKGIKQFLVGQYHTFRLFWFDVRPAINARKQERQDDLISHLIDLEYKPLEILTECLLFNAAGMVTTREFISVAAYHMLKNERLRNDYLAAEHKERHDILHEILRLEPVVGKLHRRTTSPIELEGADGEIITIPNNALIELHIYDTNLDEEAVGNPSDIVCTHRDLSKRVQPFGMSFGDGYHRCPGAFIAIEETDIFLTRFLTMPGLRIEQDPNITRNDLIEGYEIRDFVVAVD
ncbi:MAG: cytochrome P450 [Chloroflexota bacterium]